MVRCESIFGVCGTCHSQPHSTRIPSFRRAFDQFKLAYSLLMQLKPEEEGDKAAEEKDNAKDSKKAKKKGPSIEDSPSDVLWQFATQIYEKPGARVGRILTAVCLVWFGIPAAREFNTYSWMLAGQMSQPVIVFKGRTHSGETLLVDDYREAYDWLRTSTPEDARIMAWWDYGYQINGIANRTTIADGTLHHFQADRPALEPTPFPLKLREHLESRAHCNPRALHDRVGCAGAGARDLMVLARHTKRNSFRMQT